MPSPTTPSQKLCINSQPRPARGNAGLETRLLRAPEKPLPDVATVGPCYSTSDQLRNAHIQARLNANRAPHKNAKRVRSIFSAQFPIVR